MTLDTTVAVLGAGNIGSALISGLLEAKAIQPQNLVAADVSEDQLAALRKKHKIQVLPGANREAARQAAIIVLAVKPYLVGEVLDDIHEALHPGQLLISVAAGVSIEFIETRLAKKKAKSKPNAKTRQAIIRAMPNIAMTVHASATALCANTAATEEHRQTAGRIFQSVGTVAWVTEDKMHAVTGLSGSGPAYVYLILEGLTAGGVNMGLPPDVARALAEQTLLGAAKLSQQTGEHPAALRDRVTTPGGTTIAGLAELERYAVRSALMEAVEAATERSEQLSRKL
ncbi:MAG: pyrroline-5-carboxylate reductase [Bryobacterales bacterium]